MNGKTNSRDEAPELVTLPDGRKMSPAALKRLAAKSNVPLVAYGLNCNHVGKGYAVRKRDIIFCDTCGADRRVTRIIAS